MVAGELLSPVVEWLLATLGWEGVSAGAVVLVLLALHYGREGLTIVEFGARYLKVVMYVLGGLALLVLLAMARGWLDVEVATEVGRLLPLVLA